MIDDNNKAIDARATNKALFKNTGIIAIGQMSTKVINFFLLPLYTALLSTEEYGVVDLLSTYCSVLIVIVGLQLSEALFRFLVTCRENKCRIEKFISTIIITIFGVFVAYACLFAVVYQWMDVEYKWYLLVYTIVAIGLQTVSGIARGLGDNADYAAGNFISAATSLILNVVFIALFRWRVEAMLVAYIIGPLVGILFLLIRTSVLKYVHIKSWNRNCLKMVLHYALPLIPNELSWSVIHASDRIVVSNFLSIAVNGLIAVAAKFSAIYTTLFSIFNTSWTEQVVLHYKDKGGPAYISHMFDQMVTFFGCVAIGIVSCMPFCFKLLVNEQFNNAYGLIPLYMIAVFFNAIIGLISAIYLVENETKQVAISTSVAAIINIGVDVLLINIIGVYAAPVSSIAGYATISLWRLYDVNKRHCKISMPTWKVVALVGLLCVSLVGFYSNYTLVNAITFCIVLLGTVLLNKSLLLYFSKRWKKK